jgi:two-component system, response regulator RegA
VTNNRRQRARRVRKILLVDDVDLVLKTWARQAKRAGAVALCANNRRDALELARREKPDMAVIDLVMPGESGLDVIRDLRKLKPKPFILLVSGAMSVDNAMHGIAAGADDCFDKDVSIQQLITRVERGVRPAIDHNRPLTLEQVEWQYIVRALTDHGGNITHAAQALGLMRQTLQRKIRRMSPTGKNPVPLAR